MAPRQGIPFVGALAQEFLTEITNSGKESLPQELLDRGIPKESLPQELLGRGLPLEKLSQISQMLYCPNLFNVLFQKHRTVSKNSINPMFCELWQGRAREGVPLP